MENNNSNGNYNHITDIRTACMVFIILSHCLLFYDENPFFLERSGIVAGWAVYSFRFIDATLVAAYVLCAGFLFARSLDRHDRSIPHVIGRRAKRLLIPYFGYGALWVVPLYTFFDFQTFGRPDHAGYAEGYKCMLLGQFSDHLWFLWMLFWVGLFFTLTSPLLRRGKMLLLFILTIAAALCVSLLLADFPYFKLSQIAPYLICHYVGMLFYQHRDKIYAMPKSKVWLITLVLFLLLVAHCIFNPGGFAYVYLLKTVGAVFTFFLLLAFDGTAPWKKITDTNMYGFVRKNSFELFLFNMPFPYIYYRVFGPLVGDHPFICVTLMFVHTMFGIAVAIQLKKALFSAFGRLWGKTGG